MVKIFLLFHLFLSPFERKFRSSCLWLWILSSASRQIQPRNHQKWSRSSGTFLTPPFPHLFFRNGWLSNAFENTNTVLLVMSGVLVLLSIRLKLTIHRCSMLGNFGQIRTLSRSRSSLCCFHGWKWRKQVGNSSQLSSSSQTIDSRMLGNQSFGST